MNMPWVGIVAIGLGFSASIGQGAHPSDENQSIRVSEDSGPISIESDQPATAPTQEQLRQRFHDALQPLPRRAPEEHRLADGTVEVVTQVGRFCAKPAPMQSRSGVGGNIALAAPCANF
jgi:hypothetical protein